ncbi:FAD/NAD(P)-binding domain-containing protein [Phanerochaete sordida]|uniref:FAD/NAD(P)-binding domain-containing protein n=1 Tax=Phanerochaete sordida TaxID=48140 RepID=A0A9P3GI06_9APHY|nr:FAD/NAD(P)-binding domain-containing protein [Phanerochaete sordida]
MTNPDTEKIRVAIVGGGIVGLAFAISLSKAGAHAVEVDIYESASAFGQVGAGMGFWPRIWESMRTLGLEEELRPLASSGMPFRYTKGDQPQYVPFGQSPSALQSYHRADILAVLLRHIPPHYRTHFGRRLVSYSDPAEGPVELSFKDGTTATCDLLIGADGIKSAVRATMYADLATQTQDPAQKEALLKGVRPTWTGQYVYRGVIKTEDLRKAAPGHPALDGPIYFLGKDKYFVCYPVSHGAGINCGGLVSHPERDGTLHAEPWVETVPQAELRAQYTGWAPEVHSVIDLITAPSKWAINSVVDLPTYAHGRTALIGDAAHAMTPHQASGAAQGVEDGLVLAALLASPHASRTTLPRLLHAYDAVRRPFAQDVLRRSYDTGAAYCFQRGALAGLSTADSAAGVAGAVLQELNDLVGVLLEWTWTTSAASEVRAALEVFEKGVEV